MQWSPHPTASTRGFTLAELLVAMVIFLTLMSGVLVMFSASIRGVNETYARKDTFEVGRSALDVMARDLQAAFTAREQGDLYNFYGTPNGFMFVGALQDGRLGRVTYAFREAGETADLGTEAGAIGADTDGDGIPDLERQVIRPVYWLIRYEEPGVTNLDDFALPTGVQWPRIHPVTPLRDSDPLPETGERLLKDNLLLALRRLYGTTDMRDVVWEMQFSQLGGLHVVDSNFVEQLVATKKRDIWIAMLAGADIDPHEDSVFPANVLVPQPGVNLNNDFFARILAERGHDLADYAVAENILKVLDIDETTGVAKSPRLLPNGWMAVDTRAFVTYAGPDGSKLSHFNTLENYNFQNAPDVYFQRQPNGDPPLLRKLNDVYASDMDPDFLQHFDDGLANVLAGKRGTATAYGLPLLPRIPAMVEPNFEVYHAPARVGGVPFVERFSQAIEVPAGLTRGLPPSLAPSPS